MSGCYNVILCDPPWKFRVWREAGKGRTAATYYPTMDVKDICALPVIDLAAKDCTLFIWGTWPTLKDTMKVMEAWKFEYKTCAFLWAKLTRNLFKFHMGLGYWTRANTEYCLLATRGNPKRVSKAVRQLVLAPVRERSRKPDEVHEKIVDLMGDVPRIELFARRQVPGWDALGDAIDGRKLEVSLRKQADMFAGTESEAVA